jgi:hypothetical protein
MSLSIHSSTAKAKIMDADKLAWEKQKHEADSNVRTIINAAGPIFDREELQAICAQLEGPVHKGQKIIVRGLDGIRVEFEMDTGSVHSSHRLDDEDYIVFVYLWAKRPQLEHS